MTEVEAAPEALAQLGQWHGSADGDAELVRVEIRRAARRRIKVRTAVDAIGHPLAVTPTASLGRSRGEGPPSTRRSPEPPTYSGTTRTSGPGGGWPTVRTKPPSAPARGTPARR